MATQDDGRKYSLKPLSPAAIPKALEKAETYRLLNEPAEAESICRDILRVASDNQQALIYYLLALTDQFAGAAPTRRLRPAQELIPKLEGEYERAYYSGLILERYAKAWHEGRAPRTGQAVYEWLRQAMDHYEEAMKLAPPGNDDATLRWNACVRMIRNYDDIEPALPEPAQPLQLE
jgi:hypothetical protein